MGISAISQSEPSYIESVNKKNIEEQDKRNAENVVKFRKLQIQMEDLREMQSGYELSKLPMGQALDVSA